MEHVLEIRGVVCRPVGKVTDEETLMQFEDAFLDLVAAHGLSFGGSCTIMTEEDYLMDFLPK